MSPRWGMALTGALAGIALAPLGVAMAGSAASAATGDEVSAKVTFSCAVGSFPAYAWNPTVTLSAVREAGSTTVLVTAHTTEMAPVAPATLDYDVTNGMTVDVGGTTVTLSGKGHVKAPPSSTFAMPDVSGTFSSAAPDVPVTVTSYTFSMAGMKGTCTPTAGAALGSMTIVTGALPPPTIVPTTTSSATAKPSSSASASATASAPADDSGTPAKGKVTFACLLNQTNSKFTYPVTISVSGYRAKDSDPLSLSATMTDIPGIAPVTVDGTMNVTLGISVGGTTASLTGSTHAKADPYQAVPVPTLTGSVSVSGAAPAVVVKTFRFEFPDLSIDADCTAPAVSLKGLTVGRKASTTGTSGGSGTSSSGGSSGSGSTLPKTGGDNLGLLLAWGLSLSAMGACGLVLVRRR